MPQQPDISPRTHTGSQARRGLLHGAALALVTQPLALRAASGPDTDIALLTRQAQAWDEAIVRKDEAAIAANMAQDFRQIDGDGDMADKAMFLRDIVSPRLKIVPYTVEDFDIRLYGDVALLSGRTRMSGHYAGKAFASHYRYIDVYVRRAGLWQIVSVQITRLPAPA